MGIHQLPELPASSLVREELRAPHYVDVFAVSLDPARYPTMKEVLAELDRRPPWWLRGLSAMRNFAAKRLRLKRVRLRAAEHESTGAQPPRKRLKSFELYRDEENEVVFGLDDRHLDFRSSLLIDEGAADFADTPRV
jgi:hypothetical protein